MCVHSKCRALLVGMPDGAFGRGSTTRDSWHSHDEDGERITSRGATPGTFLLEMAIAAENFSQAFTAHGLHGYAIGQAIAFVKAVAVEVQTGKKRFVSLRQDTNIAVAQHGLDVFRSLVPEMLSPC